MDAVFGSWSECRTRLKKKVAKRRELLLSWLEKGRLALSLNSRETGVKPAASAGGDPLGSRHAVLYHRQQCRAIGRGRGLGS